MKILRFLIILIFISFSFNTSLSQWEQVGFYNSSVLALTTKNNVVIAGIDSTIYQTLDFGLSWDTLAVINGPLIVVLKNIEGILYSGNARGIVGNPFLSTCIFRSVDNGISWDSVYAAVFGTTEITGLGNTIFANADGKLIRSMDGGQNWMIIPSIPEWIVSITLNDNYVFACASDDSLYRSDDLGSTWASIENGLPDDAKGYLVSKNDTICVICSDSIYISPDNGNNWTNITHEIPVNLSPSGLFIIDDYLFCSIIFNDQIYMTSLSNINWSNISNGYLPAGYSFVFEMILCNEYLFIASSSGVWRRPFSQLVKLDNPKFDFQLQDYNLYQNYPNPFNTETIISYYIPEYEKVDISVFDVQGKFVINLINEYQQPGSHSLSWQGKNISSGIYYIRLSTSNTTLTKKCILLK